MQFSFRLSKKRVLLAMLLIACATSLMGSLVSDMLRMPAACALAPVGDFVKASTSAFKSAMADYEEPVMSASEAARLRKEVDQWRGAALAHSREKMHWWRMYRSVQKTRNAYRPVLKKYELIPARVILDEALPYGRSQTVAKGTIHGVKKGMRVIDVLTDRSKALPVDDRMRAITGYSPVAGKPIACSVLVGWVEAAGSFTARVRLVTDKRFKIDAHLERMIDAVHSRKITVKTPDGPTEITITRQNSPHNKLIKVTLSGDGERGLITDPIAKEHNIRVGDWLWSVGRSLELGDEQLRIGAVVSVAPSDENPNFVIAKVAPAAELGALRDIFIVRSLVSKLPPSRGGN